MKYEIQRVREMEAMGEDLNASKFNSVYGNLYDCIGLENTIKVYAMFRGQQITFPIRLIAPEYAYRCVRERFDGTNIKQLAHEFGYSEKWIRRILKNDDNKSQNKKN